MTKNILQHIWSEAQLCESLFYYLCTEDFLKVRYHIGNRASGWSYQSIKMLDGNSFWWFSFTQLSFQITEATVAAQDLDGLLLYSGGCDAKIFQARHSWVQHVCCVKLGREKQNKLSLWHSGMVIISHSNCIIINVYFCILHIPCLFCHGLSKVQMGFSQRSWQQNWNTKQIELM